MNTKFTVDQFISYKQILGKSDEKDHLDIIEKIRKASSIETNPPLLQIREAGLLPILINYHRGRKLNNETKQNILWAITNIASGDSGDTMYVISQGGIEYFLEFCNDPCEDVYAQALWGLSNLAGESASIRDKLLNLNTLQIALNIFNNYKNQMKLETKRTIAWLINNLCRYKPPVNYYQVKECLPYLNESLANETNKELIMENLWTCAYVSDSGDNAITGFINSGILNRITTIILEQSDNITIITPALRTMSNIVSGSDEATDYVINLNVVPTIIPLLSHIKIGIRKEVCFFLSNIAAGTANQIDYIFKFPSLIPKLKNIILSDDVGVKVEALWVIGNSMMGGSKEHKLNLIKSELYYDILNINLVSLGVKGIRIFLEGLKEYVNFSYEENLKMPEIIKIIDALKMTSGPSDYISTYAMNAPEIDKIFKEIIETIDDYNEDVLSMNEKSEKLDKQFKTITIGDNTNNAINSGGGGLDQIED